MEPTLKINDRVLVVKDTIMQLDIASGDIVVFYNNDGLLGMPLLPLVSRLYQKNN